VKKQKIFPDLRKGQVFDSVNFPMMMREGERSKKKHQNKKYQVTNKTQKARKTLRKD
jgi:hypothetical protein